MPREREVPSPTRCACGAPKRAVLSKCDACTERAFCEHAEAWRSAVSQGNLQEYAP